jgi:hypothetical protein
VTSRRRPTNDLLLYLRMLAGDSRSDRFLELRWPTAEGWMTRGFFASHETYAAAWRICRLAPRTDVYVGVALRDCDTRGGKDAISGSRVVYIDSDRADSARRLAAFAYPPTMEVASGTPGHLQLYWRLYGRARNEQIESANRRLALELGGDPASVDVARILRPPDTLNHKHDPPREVRLLAHRPAARYTLAELTSDLPPDRIPAPARHSAESTRRVSRTPLDSELLAIPPAEYVRVLAGLAPNRAGKVICPFHDDTNPSLQLYSDGTFYCFGCRIGGTIIDFAAKKWGLATRGRAFLELRRRLAVTFDLGRSEHLT